MHRFDNLVYDFSDVFTVRFEWKRKEQLKLSWSPEAYKEYYLKEKKNYIYVKEIV